MGFLFESPKEKKRRILKENVRKGTAVERNVAFNDGLMDGWTSKKTRKGPDFEQTRTNILNGKKEKRYKEVKSDNARESKIQKEAKKKLGKKYVLDRRDSLFWG